MSGCDALILIDIFMYIIMCCFNLSQIYYDVSVVGVISFEGIPSTTKDFIELNYLFVFPWDVFLCTSYNDKNTNLVQSPILV